MKRNKWQRLAAIGLCGSLLVNAFSGVTAVAETVTIESSPTAESSVKEETQASSEKQVTSETTTETSREEVTQETEKQAEVVAEKKEAPPVKAEQEEAEAAEENQSNSVPLPVNGIDTRAGNLETAFSQFESLLVGKKYYTSSGFLTLPSVTVGLEMAFDNEEDIVVSDFSLTSQVTHTTTTPSHVTSTTNSNPIITPSTSGFDITFPSITLQWNAPYMGEMWKLKETNLKVPKYIENVTVSSSKSMSGFATHRSTVSPALGTLMAVELSDGSYQIGSPVTNGSWVEGLVSYYKYWGNVTISPTTPIQMTSILPDEDLKLLLIHKKVTENFVDATGAKITPPIGFTQGQQTSITSNDFTYTSAKALPDMYTAGGKAYKFKGWYKGTDKTALKTTKTPSYAVTYDDKDDMTAVYEDLGETKTYNLPAKDVYFGYVDEAGNLLNPADFTVEAELGESTAT
ncbi:WxL domain-containing protein, partial [Enterococcus faecalis]